MHTLVKIDILTRIPEFVYIISMHDHFATLSALFVTIATFFYNLFVDIQAFLWYDRKWIGYSPKKCKNKKIFCTRNTDCGVLQVKRGQ